MPDATWRQNTAREVILQAVDQAIAESINHGIYREVFTDPDDGEICIEYNLRSKNNYGHVTIVYKPLAVVIKLLEECETEFDEWAITVKDKTKGSVERIRLTDKISAEAREKTIREMAWFGTMTLLTSFPLQVNNALEDGFDNSLFLAGAAVTSQTAKAFSEFATNKIVADAQPDIDRIADRVRRRRKEELERLLRKLPHLTVTRESAGRPEGSRTDPTILQTRQAERRERILQAIRDRYPRESANGNYLIKEVAESLGISSRTLSNWIGDEMFEDLVAEALRRKT